MTRVAHWLRHGEGGYRLGARPAEGGDVDRLTIAVPVKGRLREPSVSLLEDAGLGPEQPGERALAFPCRNAPVDVLLVRAADVPEYVQDGVVDCGITGQDLVRERGARVEELLELGFGSCRLEAAVPEESRYQRIEDLAGATIATVYPRLTRELLPVEVELVDVTGSVEIAPRLGLADGIVDLVSSGNTLRTNGLRSLGTLFSSQAVLIGKPGADAGHARLDDARRRRGARAPLPDAEHARGGARRGLRRSSARARRACCRSPSRGWSRCTRSCRRPRSGGCCRSSRRPAPRRSSSFRSSG